MFTEHSAVLEEEHEMKPEDFENIMEVKYSGLMLCYVMQGRAEDCRWL